MESVKQAYYGNLFPLNPGIIPSGLIAVVLLEPHGRDSVGKRAVLKIGHETIFLCCKLQRSLSDQEQTARSSKSSDNLVHPLIL